jgi:hypothetical protein
MTLNEITIPALRKVHEVFASELKAAMDAKGANIAKVTVEPLTKTGAVCVNVVPTNNSQLTRAAVERVVRDEVRRQFPADNVLGITAFVHSDKRTFVIRLTGSD